MKKIPQLFKMNFETHRIENEINKGCEWVAKGEGVATRKFDGTACLILKGELYKRYDCKEGRNLPEYGFACQPRPDPITGHWPWWIPVTDKPEDKWYWKGDKKVSILYEEDGTYELCGPKINGNPERFGARDLIRHGSEKCPQCPRDYEGIKEFLMKEGIEGIVWYRDNGEMCKVKLRDYGIKRR